jgi:hypothetical protein
VVVCPAYYVVGVENKMFGIFPDRNRDDSNGKSSARAWKRLGRRGKRRTNKSD